MTETNHENASASAESQPEKPPNFGVRLANRFPRTARAFAVIGVGAVVVGGAKLAKNVLSNKDNLEAAADHAGAAFDEVAASMSPSDSET